MKKKVLYVLLLFFIQCFTGCLEVYNPPQIQGNDSYLVVEGFLDVSNKSCTIKLTRTLPLSGESDSQLGDNISVIVESDDNRKFILTPQSDGVFSLQAMSVFRQSKYRLRILDGENVYVSDFVDASTTPPIDDFTWGIEDDMVRLYISTHNTSEGTRYYQWRFEETWEYHSAFWSLFKLQKPGAIVAREKPDELYYCWKTDRSSTINLGTTKSLDSDIISNYMLRELPMNSAQFQTRYSILVSQFSLTREEYDFWSQVRDNTASTGSLFDVQPSRIKGNIACENCNLPIIGYFSANTVQQKRIFINSEELPLSYFEFETGYENCRADSLLLENVPDFGGPQMIVEELIETIEGQGPRQPPIQILLGYWVAQPVCVDCTLKGGVTTKPSFWE
jgi:hypothetical protein